MEPFCVLASFWYEDRDGYLNSQSKNLSQCLNSLLENRFMFREVSGLEKQYELEGLS